MRSGFSLVELSIVLVILGLLTGGILTGQTLIRAAELRAVTTEYQNFQSATQTFRDKYFAVPGDMRNATRFWERQVNATHCVTNSAAAVDAAGGACDGNGNGVVDGGVTTNANSAEVFQYWRQLANAGLVEGTYTGITSAAGNDASSFGVNIPRSKLSNAGWGVFTDTTAAGLASEFTNQEYGNGFSFGATVATGVAINPALVPEEAWNIDTKVDDGQPSQGAVIGYPFTDGQCVNSTGATDNAADYALIETGTNCALIFSRQF